MGKTQKRTIVFDIETSSYPFESLSESQREYLLRYAEKETNEEIKSQKISEVKRYLNLYPFTAKVIAVGFYDVLKEKTFVYYESNEKEEWHSDDKKINYKGLKEEDILKSFWRIVEVSNQFITFNGRNFDIPFLMMRSAIKRIKPAKNLNTSRYDKKLHIDLLEQFTYYGLTKKFNLDFYCRAFGVESPKSQGISGMEVKNLYDAGKIKEIAVYCGKDVIATYELYKIWDEFLNI